MLTFDDFWADVCLYKLELGFKYHEYENGIKYANGCGAKGGIKFPDTMYYISVISACIIHDIDWYKATCYQDLLDANERFDNNLKKICDRDSMNDLTKWFRRMRIAKYVSGVELYGTESYAKDRGFL